MCLQEAMCDCVDWLVLRHRFLFYFPSFYPRNSLGYVSNEGKVHSSGLLIKGLFLVFFLISFKSQWSSSALSLSHGLISSILAQCESTEWPMKCFNASRTCVQCLQPSSSVFRVESCEVFYVLKEPWRSRKCVEQRGVTVLGSFLFVKVALELPTSSYRYSNSSRCFLLRAGPWPFLKEPFWGRRRCPRSCSFHGTPFCPSSLSRSESECMRAEEVGAGMGFSRAA